MRRETTTVITGVLILVAFGAIMVYSASDGTLLRWHLFCAALGGVALYIAVHLDYHRLRDPLLFRFVLISSLGLLVLVLTPGIGLEVDGARRWISIAGFRFQPSEYAKFALILLLAVKLTDNQQEIKRFWGGFLAPMLATGLFAALVLAERDLGIPVMMVAVAFVMICIAGARWRYLIASVAPLMGGVFLLIVMAPHRVQRLAAFISPWEHRDAAGWQLIQSLSAFAQ
ncbi:MAG: FtsW/RodA/SpoVE family cell cycle protein, partial [Thermoanaerobaculia bacterium]|nr:FtsW/RodA/SpoVE family cell cycle protein [Thermoanaerobaculia bacterium]